MSAEQPPPSSETRTFICTVVFVDLVEYSRQTVGQQAALKQHLNELIGRSLVHVAESDRMAIDTGDGAALCFFGDPEDALFAAASLREAVTADPGPSGTQIRIGINLGPARVVRDLNGNRNIIGDGINVAQRVMGFAAPNQILVSRSYYEVVSHISTEYSQLFQYAGLHRDKHIREHEVYEVHVRPRPQAAADPGAPGAAGGAEAPRPAGDEPSTAFSPELLARVTGTLTRHLGPVARLIVQRAALQAGDLQQLLASVAGHLAGASREAFLAEAAGGAAPRSVATRPGASEPRAGGPQPAPRTPGPITPEVLAAAADQLARHVGPIARVLVARAAKDAEGADQLAERLAAHIADPQAREAFLAAMHGR